MKSKKTLIAAISTLVSMFLIASSILFPLGGVGNAKATATYGIATSADLLSGKIATVDAGQITGTMPNKVGSVTVITPRNSFQAIPQGYYDGTVSAGSVLGDPNLTGANIISGKSIYGVAGTAINGAGMKKTASGSLTQYFYPSIDFVTVSGLGFTPKRIIIMSADGNQCTSYFADVTTDSYFLSGDKTLMTTPLGYFYSVPYINATGFMFPIRVQPDQTYYWFASE